MCSSDLIPRELPPPPAQPTPPAPPPPSSPASVWPLRIVGLSGVALGLVGLGVGLAGLSLREEIVARFNADPDCGTNDLTPSCNTLFEEGNQRFVMGVAGLAVGGVLLVGGVTATLLGFRRSLPVAVAAGPRGVAVSGSF